MLQHPIPFHSIAFDSSIPFQLFFSSILFISFLSLALPECKASIFFIQFTCFHRVFSIYILAAATMLFHSRPSFVCVFVCLCVLSPHKSLSVVIDQHVKFAFFLCVCACALWTKSHKPNSIFTSHSQFNICTLLIGNCLHFLFGSLSLLIQMDAVKKGSFPPIFGYLLRTYHTHTHTHRWKPTPNKLGQTHTFLIFNFLITLLIVCQIQFVQKRKKIIEMKYCVRVCVCFWRSFSLPQPFQWFSPFEGVLRAILA